MYRDDSGLFTWRPNIASGEQRCLVLASGVFPVEHDISFQHPGPAFTRIFHFNTGSAVLSLGRKRLTLDPGRTWLLPTGRSFTVRYAAGSRFHFFHLRCLDALGQDIFSTVGEPEGRDLGPLAALLCAAHGNNGDGECRLWQPLLLAATAHFQPEGRTAAIRGERHRELIAHVLRHAGNALNVAALAKREGLSPAALSKRFQRDTGMGLKRWLLQTAMERARELLADGALPVQAVADRLGYADPFHFQRVFKQCVGLTPSAFRRSLRMEHMD